MADIRKAKVEVKGNDVVITAPLDNPEALSSTGKTFLIANLGETIAHDGRVVKVSLNVTRKNADYKR